MTGMVRRIAWSVIMLAFVLVLVVALSTALSACQAGSAPGHVCGDGSVSHAVHRQGACTGHGGIRNW